MRKLSFSERWTAWCILLLLCGFSPLLLISKTSALRPVGPAHRVHDWTVRHVIYPRWGTLSNLNAAAKDPRAQFAWREFDRQTHEDFLRRNANPWPKRRPLQQIHRDWSISLGNGTVAKGMFPAKFSFDVNATVSVAAGSCTSDFTVFPINVNGSSTQPNLVAFDNLYSGTAGATGICNRTVTGSDTGVDATTFWSYNVQGITGGGAVTTSPVLSLDGSKVAFVESAAGSPAHFHVLAWKSGQGVNAGNLQDALTKTVTISSFSSTAPSAGSGAATDLALGASTTGTDTLSSPFIDYIQDLAYVGNDIGILYRIKDVFCNIPGCTTAAPSLDASWGTNGAVTVACGAKLTGAVVDITTHNVFVGCSDGKLYGFTSKGIALATPSIAVGDGSATGGIVDPPVVDGVNGFVFAAAGTGAGANNTHAVMIQATTSLGGPCTGSTVCIVAMGASGVFSTHAPAFNDAYFSSATSTNWLLFEMAYSNNANLTEYAAAFDTSRHLVPGAPTAAHTSNFGTHMGEFAPTTEFLNGATDQLFFSILHAPVAAVNTLGVFQVNTFQTTPLTGVSEGAGTSGMVVDNLSAAAQASSIYFGVQGTTAQGGNVAVKLTQSAFQ